MRTGLRPASIALLFAAVALAAGALAAPVAADHAEVHDTCDVAVWDRTIRGTNGTMAVGNASLDVVACAWSPFDVNQISEVRVEVFNHADEPVAARVNVSADGERVTSRNLTVSADGSAGFNTTVSFASTGGHTISATGAGSFGVGVVDCAAAPSGDSDCDGIVTIQDLAEAAASYVQGQISITELGDVAAAYVRT